MGSTTPIHGLHYPSSGDAPNGPAQIEQLADDLDAALPVVTDTAPAAPVAGLLWYAPTADVLKFYDGTAWQTYKSDSGWVNITGLASGWSNDSSAPQVRQIGNRVYFQGGVTNTSFNQTTFTTVFSLPTGISPPTGTRVYTVFGVAARGVRLLGDGSVQLWSSAASTVTFSLDPISYMTD